MRVHVERVNPAESGINALASCFAACSPSTRVLLRSTRVHERKHAASQHACANARTCCFAASARVSAACFASCAFAQLASQAALTHTSAPSGHSCVCTRGALLRSAPRDAHPQAASQPADALRTVNSLTVRTPASLAKQGLRVIASACFAKQSMRELLNALRSKAFSEHCEAVLAIASECCEAALGCIQRKLGEAKLAQ